MFRPSDNRLSAIASLANLPGLLAIMLAYRRINSDILRSSTPLTSQFILHYFSHAIFSWLLIEKLTTLLPASKGKQRLVYCLLLSFF